MATTISIPGGSGNPPLVFKVTGTSTTNYAVAFQNAVAGNTPTLLSGTTGTESSTPGALNEILTDFRGTGSQGTAYNLTTGGQYTVADVGTNTTVNGSASGMDTVLGSGAVTYNAVGNDNQVTFIDGANNYNGGTATGDTITGGSGADVISTSTGFSTVFSGAGSTTITLNDTVGSASSPGGLVYLGDGVSTVDAAGLNDVVVAATNGQEIFGGTDTASTLTIAVEDNATSSGPAGDYITAGAGTTNIFDSVGGNSIFGGADTASTLTFVGGPAATGSAVTADSIYGRTGPSYLLGASGDSLTFAGDTSGSVATFVAGTGNETLNAADAGGRVNFFGSTDTTSSETFNGSTTGFNYFQTGGTASTVSGTTATTGGSESLFGGNGTNVFGIADGGANSHITIYDFAAGNDSVNFLGETSAQVTADLNAATVTSAGLTVTLSDNTTVTFSGLTNVSQLHTPGSGST